LANRRSALQELGAAAVFQVLMSEQMGRERFLSSMTTRIDWQKY
jgi:hypothetical protein